MARRGRCVVADVGDRVVEAGNSPHDGESFQSHHELGARFAPAPRFGELAINHGLFRPEYLAGGIPIGFPREVPVMTIFGRCVGGLRGAVIAIGMVRSEGRGPEQDSNGGRGHQAFEVRIHFRFSSCSSISRAVLYGCIASPSRYEAAHTDTERSLFSNPAAVGEGERPADVTDTEARADDADAERQGAPGAAAQA
jgi:hypothetical protein